MYTHLKLCISAAPGAPSLAWPTQLSSPSRPSKSSPASKILRSRYRKPKSMGLGWRDFFRGDLVASYSELTSKVMGLNGIEWVKWSFSSGKHGEFLGWRVLIAGFVEEFTPKTVELRVWDWGPHYVGIQDFMGMNGNITSKRMDNGGRKMICIYIYTLYITIYVYINQLNSLMVSFIILFVLGMDWQTGGTPGAPWPSVGLAKGQRESHVSESHGHLGIGSKVPSHTLKLISRLSGSMWAYVSMKGDWRTEHLLRNPCWCPEPKNIQKPISFPDMSWFQKHSREFLNIIDVQ